MLSRLRIALGVAAIIFCSIPASHSEAVDGCYRIVGDWGWFIGGKVSFSAMSVARWTPATKGTPPATGTWQLPPTPHKEPAYGNRWVPGDPVSPK